jgi:YD repeat-containing protein
MIEYAVLKNGGSNAGKIVSQTDNVSGETVTYAYDSLSRLTSASASGNAWTQTYSYDGFGNLTNRTGTLRTASKGKNNK